MELKETVKKFAEVFGRGGIDMGSLQYEETAVAADDLDGLYALLRFDKVLTVGGALFFHLMPESRLDMAQDGFYRIKVNGIVQEDNKHWNASWIVFATRNDDPVFINRTDGTVKGAVDKRRFYDISPSLSVFFEIISECMLLESEKYSFKTFGEDDEVPDSFRNDALGIVLKYADEDSVSGFDGFFFG